MMNVIREMIEETKIGRLRLKYAERVRQAYNEGYKDALLTTADTWDDGWANGYNAAIDIVKSLHYPTVYEQTCDHCESAWPCATIEALKERVDMNKESEILDGGIDIGHSIVESPASFLRRTTSSLLTSIKHRYYEDDICIDCGYAERKGYEDAIRDAIEVIESLWSLDMPDGSPAVYRSDAIASLKDLMEGQ